MKCVDLIHLLFLRRDITASFQRPQFAVLDRFNEVRFIAIPQAGGLGDLGKKMFYGPVPPVTSKVSRSF